MRMICRFMDLSGWILATAKTALSRTSKGSTFTKALFCVHNFTPTYFDHYVVPLKHVRHLNEVFNTDDMGYGGSGKIHGCAVCHADQQGNFFQAEISLPPLSTTIYEVEWR